MLVTDVFSKTPAVLGTKADEKTSDKYRFFSTYELVDILAPMGWFPVKAQQRKSKKNPDTTRHMVEFRNDDYRTTKVGDVNPRINLINSHDGSTPFTFLNGLFRLVCSNGLVIPAGVNEQYRIRHMGATEEDVRNIVQSTAGRFSDIIGTIDRWGGRMLTKDEAEKFALDAYALRYPALVDEHGNVLYSEAEKVFNPIEFLTPRRNEDAANDLWSVFNVVQENLIKGGFQHKTNQEKGERRARPIKDIIKNVELNTHLWKLAETVSLS